jgi:CRISPR-associated protein Csb1
MSVDLQPLANQHDLIFKIPLKVRLGHRFQPTGFPDLGAAVFETVDGTSLLVESAQSMANRLEGVCWDESENDLIGCLRGLSYVKVVLPSETGEPPFLTSSVIDSHRLNSPYILESRDKTLFNQIQSELGGLAKGPINRKALATTLLKYDVGSLIHGVFLAKKELAGGRLRIARALTAFIEADRASVAASGGSKQDHVDPTGEAFDQGGAAKGFGHIPFPRDEYTAPDITLFASLDLSQIRGYGLGDDATRMLMLLSLYKLRAFIESPMRLRTACMFERKGTGDIPSLNIDKFNLPDSKALEADLPLIIDKLTKGGAFAGTRGVSKATFKST